MKITLTNLFIFLLLGCSSGSFAQKISPNLVGNNVWYIDPSQEVWDLTEKSGVTMMRIGGNGYNDNLPDRATLLKWVKNIRAIGAEPIMQVSQHQSAQAAADLVKYFNIELKGEIAPIKYWNIGNEPWLEADRPAISEVAPLVEAYFKPRAVAMKEADPTIKIYGPDFAYYIEPAINELFGGANDMAGKIPGKDYYYCDGLSWHRYPQDADINLAYEGIEDFKESIIKCKQKVDQINATYNRTGDEALQWGIGEYNAKGGPQVHTWENGQMFGGVLGLCMEYEAVYACTWSMFENGGNRQGTDFSFIDGANMTPRASYRHMQFVANYFTGVYSKGVADNNDFFIYGAIDGERTAVMVMHRAAGAPKEYTLHLNTDTKTGEGSILNIDANKQMSYSDIIGERTTQVIIFEGDSITKINYSSVDFDNELAPSLSVIKETIAAPAKPNGVTITPKSYRSIELTWSDQSDNEQGFVVERKGQNEFEIVGVLAPNTTSFIDDGLSAATEYSYRVKAYNVKGKSEFSEEVKVTTLDAPEQKSFNGPHSIPGVIEAEDFDDNDAGTGYLDIDPENKGGAYRETGVDIEVCSEGGFNVGYINEGEWLTYLVEDVTAGIYNVEFRFASNAEATRSIEVYIDTVKVGEVSPIVTGGWQEWDSLVMKDIEIANSAPLQLTLKFTGGSFNLNHINFKKAEDLVAAIPAKKESMQANATFIKRDNAIYIDAKREIENCAVEVVSIEGKVLFHKGYKNFIAEEIKTTNWAKGLYIVKVVSSSKKKSIKVLVQ